jgi:hypothetical protein
MQLHAAAGRTIGLSQYQRDLMTGVVQGFERYGGEFRGACEDDFHGAIVAMAAKMIAGQSARIAKVGASRILSRKIEKMFIL